MSKAREQFAKKMKYMVKSDNDITMPTEVDIANYFPDVSTAVNNIKNLANMRIDTCRKEGLTYAKNNGLARAYSPLEIPTIQELNDFLSAY